MLGTSDALVHQNGSISCPKAPPKGFASDATAVAAIRPFSVNQSSLYRVGAARTNGCALENVSFSRPEPHISTHQTNQDLPKHDQSKHASRRSMRRCARSRVPQPVSQQDEHTTCDSSRLRSTFVQNQDNDGRCDNKSEKEGSAEPINRSHRNIEVLGTCCRHGREGQPVPADDDIQQHKLHQSKPASLVYSVLLCWRCIAAWAFIDVQGMRGTFDRAYNNIMVCGCLTTATGGLHACAC